MCGRLEQCNGLNTHPIAERDNSDSNILGLTAIQVIGSGILPNKVRIEPACTNFVALVEVVLEGIRTEDLVYHP